MPVGAALRGEEGAPETSRLRAFTPDGDAEALAAAGFPPAAASTAKLVERTVTARRYALEHIQAGF